MTEKFKDTNVYDYVASGPSYMSLTVPICAENPELIEDFNQWFKLIRSIPGFELSILYNALTEISRYLLPYRDRLDGIYADSGGLQLFTRKLKVTDKVRKRIYKKQMAAADYAMSFDMLPVKAPDGKTGVNDFKWRWLDRTNFEACAIQSGKHLEEQITFFRENNAKTHPIMIVHGSTYEDYCLWTERMIEQISPDNLPYLDTLAISAASSGIGDMEEVERFFYSMHLPISEHIKHIHFLGFGSVRRLLPLLAMVFSGKYQNLRISFDSTSHTMAPFFANCFLDGNILRFEKSGKNVRAKYQHVFEQIQKIHPLPMTSDVFFESINTQRKIYKEANDGSIAAYLSRNSIIFASMYHFCLYMRKLLDLGHIPHDLEYHQVYNSLIGVKSIDDFKYWKKDIGYLLNSQSINSAPPTTLEDYM